MSRSGNEVCCPMPGLTISEKILARASHAEVVRPGQIIDGEVDLLYMHEMLAMALLPFNEIGTTAVWDPNKIVVTLDHWVPPPTPEIAKMHQTIRDFCHKQGIQRFHDVGDHGIVHQLIAERGYAHPGELIIGSDSHTNMVGAVGAFAAGIGATDTAAVMASGRLWLRVPETLRVDIRGTLSERTTAKDVILKVIGTTGDDGARYAAVEFTGSTVKGFPMNERFVLCNMTTEMGAKVGLIEAAQVACPSNPANLKPVEDVEGTKIDVAFLGSCTNARIEDLRIAAGLLKGEKVARRVRFQITPASQIIY